ncbi:hypothetical protein [Cryocola sp. 340MFSha3.1]|uniref:hypothetical protein n=1 Tax=Cryocola sp. 340MFSha3.1 TaxID=1169145 RepID=UPI00036613E5|nr:hypothetical protein [Cryocola sp. 340MFSha3.1]
MNGLRASRLRLRRDQSGVAVLAVVGLASVMLIVIATALTVSVGGMKRATNDADWNAALAAAYAGVDEYASRLANDSTYTKYGNPASTFTIRTGSKDTVTLPTASPNPAFAVGAGAGWASVPGTSGAAAFRYEVDNSQYTRNGVIRVRSTGKVGSQTRSVIANLKQQGFLQFLYFTNYEIIDPAIQNLGSGATACVPSYAFKSGGTITHKTNCQEIEFASKDVINGPLHSNDELRICGTTFLGDVSTSSSLTPSWVNTCPTGALPKWYNGATGPSHKDALDIPPTNLAMANEARVDLSDVPRPGCLYTGPTTITFTSDGKMRVVSPWTKVTQPSFTSGIASNNPTMCGTPGAGTGNLGDTNGAVIPVLDSNLIYVQNVPGAPAGGAAADPNYSATPPSGVTCTNVGAKNEGWSFGGTQYPAATETIPPTAKASAPAYGCRNGDAYVKGVMKGALTIASQNYIYVTGSITYTDRAADMLGLVGQNAVWLLNQMACTTSTRSACTPLVANADVEIDAAILCVQHTFMVQNYEAAGKRGTLTVFGAIAQYFRGPVAQGDGSGGTSSGYVKSYWYDQRLRSAAPPKFLAPTSTTYGVTQYSDVSPAFTSDGTAR